MCVELQATKAEGRGYPDEGVWEDRREVAIIAQGGARMDLFPTVQEAAVHARHVYQMGITYFDCAHNYWNGKSEEAYGRSR